MKNHNSVVAVYWIPNIASPEAAQEEEAIVSGLSIEAICGGRMDLTIAFSLPTGSSL